MTDKVTSPHISQITNFLYISAWPRGQHVAEIVTLGVRLVLSMHWIRPTKLLGQSPIQLMWLPTIDNPFFPMPIKTLTKGVRAALPVIQNGDGVLVHCIAGVHRSVAQATCVLIGMGYTADDAMALIKEKRAVADPYVGYIQKRIKKFELEWQHKDQDSKVV
jgi:protein-tyrosine phosphatase